MNRSRLSIELDLVENDAVTPFDDAEELAAAIAASPTPPATTGERPSVQTPKPGRVPG